MRNPRKDDRDVAPSPETAASNLGDQHHVPGPQRTLFVHLEPSLLPFSHHPPLMQKKLDLTNNTPTQFAKSVKSYIKQPQLRV